jgi:hypothetical protein
MKPRSSRTTNSSGAANRRGPRCGVSALPVFTALLAAQVERKLEICALLWGCAPNFYHRSMFIIPHGAPEGYEWFVTLVVLVGLYFAVRNFMRARR